MESYTEIKLNPNAKEFIPKNKIVMEPKVEPKVQLNLNAEEYKPSVNFNYNSKINNNDNEYYIKGIDEEEEESDDANQDEIDKNCDEDFDTIMKDIISKEVPIEDEEESDDEKWFPKYKDCECCKGFIYKCDGEACINLHVCYCKAKEEFDQDI